MRIDVRFFASLRELTGAEVVEIDLPRGAGLDGVMCVLRDMLSPDALTAIEGDQTKIAVNQVILGAESELNDGDEVAFLPPITGG